MSLLFETLVLLFNGDFFFFVLWGISRYLIFNLFNPKKEVLIMVFKLVKLFLFFGDFILKIFLFSKELKFVLSLLVVLLLNVFNKLDFFFVKRTFIFFTISDLNECISGGLL